MPMDNDTFYRERDNDSRAAKGKEAEGAVAAAKKQEDAQKRLADYAAKRNGGASTDEAPKQKPGEGLAEFAARRKKYNQDKQAAQAKALK
jgi:hypothetical protein